MADFNPFQKRVAKAIQDKNAEAPCPMCRTEKWQASPEPVALADTSLRDCYSAAALVCGNCGFVRLHLLGALNIE